MRSSVLRSIVALFLAHSTMAQESATRPFDGVRFRGAGVGRDVLLRDSGPASSTNSGPRRGSFSLPPGGQELELQPTTSTPYDYYFGSVRAVIATLEPQRTTMADACHLMKVGYSFRYVTRDPYRPDPPKLTEAQQAGDCKSKALWLFDNLADSNALLTIGKAEKNSRTSHAWVYWRNGGRWWILDCTDRLDPIAADSVSSDRYIPYYSFGKTGTFRHATTRVGTTATTSAVASPERKKSR